MDEIGKIFSTRSENWAISKMLVGVFREVLGHLGGFKKKKTDSGIDCVLDRTDSCDAPVAGIFSVLLKLRVH